MELNIQRATGIVIEEHIANELRADAQELRNVVRVTDVVNGW